MSKTTNNTNANEANLATPFVPPDVTYIETDFPGFLAKQRPSHILVRTTAKPHHWPEVATPGYSYGVSFRGHQGPGKTTSVTISCLSQARTWYRIARAKGAREFVLSYNKG